MSEPLNPQLRVKTSGSSSQAVLIVEEDPMWLSPYGTTRDSATRAFFSSVVTLSLGVLGSSVLPVPFAISRTGVLVGICTMLVVALANDITCGYMINAAAHTGLSTYQQLSEWMGGRPAKVVCEISLVVLLFGTMCGGLAMVADVGLVAWRHTFDDSSPAEPDADKDRLLGQGIMVAVAAAVLLPLCLQRHMRQLENAATFGVVVVVVLCVIVVKDAISSGFPAIKSGELPLWSLKVDRHLPEAFAVIGYAFYMQPMMMPLIMEMPSRCNGPAILKNAVHVTLFGVALVTYGAMGVFGAATFGDSTAGNILVNPLVTGRAAVCSLYYCMLLYLCVGMTTTQFALRATLDELLLGPAAPFTWLRQFLLTAAIIASATLVAIFFPGSAEKMFAITGATGVCVVCYLLPAAIHLTRLSRMRTQWQSLKQQAGSPTPDLLAPAADGLDAPLLAPPPRHPHSHTSSGSTPSRARQVQLAFADGPAPPGGWRMVWEWGVASTVVALGAGMSVLALYLAVESMVGGGS